MSAHDITHRKNTQHITPQLAELEKYDQFVLYEKKPPKTKDDKVGKIPVSYRNLHTASAQDPKNHASYATIRGVLSKLDREKYGVGFCLTANDPFVCLDIDHCLEGGKLSAIGQELVDALPGCAVEKSVSGDGLHVWWSMSSPVRHGTQCSEHGLELYSDKRFIAITENIQNNGGKIKLANADGERVINKYFSVEKGLKVQLPSGEQLKTTVITEERVNEALSNADPSCGYNEWLKIGMALHSWDPDRGLQVWDSWSANSPKYEAGATAKRWDGFTSGGGVSIGTILQHAPMRSGSGKGYVVDGTKESKAVIEAEIQREKAEIETGVLACVEKANKNFAIGKLENRVVIVQEERLANGHVEVSFLNTKDFKTLHENVPVRTGPKRTTELGTVWLKSPARRSFKRVEFSPSGTTPGNLNLFRGFPIRPTQGERHHSFKVFVSEVICCGNDVEFEFVWGWLSHLFQKPGELPDTSLVLRANQGVGKNFFVNAIAKLVGQHYLPLNSSNQLVGRFNKHLLDLLLVFANESLFGGDRKIVGPLNTMITEVDTVCESKGVDIIRVKNYKRLIIASNESWPIPMDLDDRRFLVLDVSDSHKKDYPYFMGIQNDLNAGGYEHLMFELLNKDISALNVRELPQSNTGFDIKLRSSSNLIQWWFEELKHGDLHPAWLLGPISQRKIELHMRYMNLCEKYFDRYPVKPHIFGKELKKICPYKCRRVAKAEGRSYIYVLPSLKECRKAFETGANLIDFDWTGS